MHDEADSSTDRRHRDGCSEEPKLRLSLPVAAGHTQQFERSRNRTSPPSGALPLTLTLVAIAWGSLAFGAVYPWAFWPLALLALAGGSAGLVEAAGHTPAAISRGLVLALGGVVTAVLLQLVPLPSSILPVLNPNGVWLRRQLELAPVAAAEALSVVPSASWLALALLASFIILLLGTASLLSLEGPRRLVEGLTIFGVVMALVGIVQKPLYAGRIYGFWTPEGAGDPFGPFVNRNHFAGWMLLTLPLAVGYLCAAIARSVRHEKPAWRDRLFWLATPEANKLVLAAGGITIMALALGLTLSRSGISALAFALLVLGWLFVRRQQGRWRKLIVVGYVALLGIVLVASVGADVLARRFGEGTFADDRLGAWIDAAAIASKFPLTGTGLNTYGVATLFYQHHDLAHHYAEAHNDYLQLAAEGGILLLVPAAICIVLFIRDVRRRLNEDRASSVYWIRAGAAAALAAIALQETFEFSLQIPGNAALFAVVAAIALHKSPEGGDGRRGWRCGAAARQS